VDRDKCNSSSSSFCSCSDSIMSMKNFNDTIWIQTCNALVAQSEQTALQCAPQFVIVLMELNTVQFVEVKCLCNKTTTSF
jgi:hypothetical protein